MTKYKITLDEATLFVTTIKHLFSKEAGVPSFIYTSYKLAHTFGYLASESCGSLPEKEGTLFIINPKAGTYHRSRVKRGFGAYAKKLYTEMNAGIFNNVYIENSFNISDFFVFIWVPTHAQDIAQNILSARFLRQGTAKYSVKSEYFYTAIVTYNNRFKWEVCVQRGVKDSVKEILARASASLRMMIKYHRLCDRIGDDCTTFFNEHNSTVSEGEYLNRSQVHSTRKLRGKNNYNQLMQNWTVVSSAFQMGLSLKEFCLTAIACVLEPDIIGWADSLPIASKSEMEHFKHTTQNSVVIMGRNTWNSLPITYRPLPDRINVVITSREINQEGVKTFRKLADAIDWCLVNHPLLKKFVIGGRTLWSEAFERGFVKEAIITTARSLDEFYPLTSSRQASDNIIRMDFKPYLEEGYLFESNRLSDPEYNLIVNHYKF